MIPKILDTYRRVSSFTTLSGNLFPPDRTSYRTYERRRAGSLWYKASPRTDARISLPCVGIVCTHHVTCTCKLENYREIGKKYSIFLNVKLAIDL